MYHYATRGGKGYMRITIVLSLYYVCIIPIVILGVSCLRFKRCLQSVMS